MAGFLNPLRLEYLDGHLWKVLEPFEYCVGSADSDIKVTIPEGFFTDFASVPRFFWRVLPPTGEYGKAAVVHDWLYRHPILLEFSFSYTDPENGPDRLAITRKECDDIFLEAMEVLEVPKCKRDILYAGVRIGGWKPWGDYRLKDSI